MPHSPHHAPVHIRRASLIAPAVVLAGLLATPALQAATPITAEEQAARRRQEQEREESRQRAAQAEAKLRQAEAEKQRLQQKLEELRAEQARPKPDPAAEQRARQLEQENAELKRQMEAAQSDKRQREKQLAEAKRQAERAEAEKRRLEGEWAATADPPAASEPRQTEASAVATAPTVASPTPSIGETIKDCAVCPELVAIPPGEFTMGSPAGEKWRDADEGPQHPVRIGYRLAVGKYEVTQGQWRAVMGGDNPSYFSACGDDCPVDSVSWDKVQQYLTKLNQMSGQAYRLLSEAEWEYACRAGGRHRYCGSNAWEGISWHVGNSGNKSHRVGTKLRNAWGLHDMSGNVWEWVTGCYKDSYEGADGQRAVQSSGCSQQVLRGGSWANSLLDLRSANRFSVSPGYRYYVSGFRLARMLP